MVNYKIAFIFLLINVSQVNAVVLTGNTTGAFAGDKSFIEWGVGRFIPGVGVSAPSSLTYESIGGFSTSTNDRELFIVGALTYKNTAITSLSSYELNVGDKSLDIGMEFTSPSIANYIFNYDLMIVETNNKEVDSADRVTLLPADNFSPNFVVDGQEFTFELVGFGKTSEGILKPFVQEEGSSETVNLYAKITAVPIPSALWLFMTALSGFIITGNRKRK